MSFSGSYRQFIKSIPGQVRSGVDGIKNVALKKGSGIVATKKYVYIFAGFVGAVSAIGLYLYFQKFSLNPNVKSALDLIPEDASMYIEIKNVAHLKSEFEKSDLGREVGANAAWSNLVGGYDMSLNTVVYFLGVKSGLTGSYSDFFSFVDGNTGLAFFPDKSWLSVTQSNVKSRLGAALVSAFKAEKVKLKPDAKEEKPRENSQGSPQTEPGMFGESQKIEYSDAFGEESVWLSNLRASRIKIGDKAVYFVLLENYLFISNNIDKLTESLKLATSPGGGLNSLKGFDKVNEDYQKKEVQSIVYLNNKTSPAAVFLNTLGESSGIAFCLKFGSKENLSGDIFLIGSEVNRASAGEKGVSFEKEIPADFSLAYFSRSQNIDRLFSSFKELGRDWDPFKKGIADFLHAGKLDAPGLFEKTRGISFVAHDFRAVNKKIVPDVSVLFESPAENKSLLEAVFKPGQVEARSFQNVTYNVQTAPKSLYYRPSSLYSGGMEILCSYDANLEKYIAARKGNMPAFSDIDSYKKLGSYKDADTHFVVNVANLVRNILEFYTYGDLRDNRYSEKTIEKDIRPLFSPFLKYQFLHVAISENMSPGGMLIVTGN